MKKTFDCVAMKHEMQERTNLETESMSLAERDEYIRRGAEEFRRQIAARTNKPNLGEFLDSLEEAASKNGKG